MNDPALLSASEQRRLIGAGELSPSELLAATMIRLERFNPRLNAVVTVNPRAAHEAREVEARLVRGEDLPLAGLVAGIKDVTPVAGLRFTYGSTLFADHVAGEDAEVVTRLRRAGAVILGKTNTPEFATGGNTFNPVFGRTRNPWNSERSAGGSTGGGAAALAAGIIGLAEGTDLGGSLRIPASFCGIVGLRPSPGLVPTVPSDFLWDTLQVSGPMARTAEDVALILSAMAGPSRRWPIAQPNMTAGTLAPSAPGVARDFVAAVTQTTLRGKRLAYVRDLAGIGVDEGVEAACRRAAFELRQAGALVEEIELDLSYGREAFLALRGLWMVIQQYDRLERRDEFGDNLRGNVEAGLKRTTIELASAEHQRARVRQELLAVLDRVDVLVTPAMAVAPFSVEENYPRTVGGREMKTYVDWIAPTFVLSLSGLPVASVPCGLDAEGLPVGLQIVGPPFGEEVVLGIAARIQEVTPIGLPDLGASS